MVQYADRVHVHMSVLYNVSCVMNHTQNRIARFASPELDSGRVAHSRFDYQTVLCFGGERHVGVHETSVLVTLFVCLFAQATTRTDAWHEKNACALPSFFHSPKHHAHAS